MLKYLILTIENSMAAAILAAMLLIAADAYSRVASARPPGHEGADVSPQGPKEAGSKGAPSGIGGVTAAGIGTGWRHSNARWARGGLIGGVAAAIIIALIMHMTIIIKREFFILGVQSFSLATTIVYIAAYWGFMGKRLPKARDAALLVSGALLPAALLLHCLPTILLYPSQFVLAGESVFSTDFLFKSIGYLAGAMTVAATAAALYRVRGGIPGRLLGILLTAALLVNAVWQFSTIVQILLGRRMIPMSKGVFSFVTFTSNHSHLFLYLIVGAALVLPFLLWFRHLRPRGEWHNPAQHRKLKAAARGIRRWSAVLLACFAVCVLSMTVAKAYDQREVTLSPAEPMTIAGGFIEIPVEDIGDGHLHRFAYTASENVEVRFIVIKKNESSWGVGLDACDICGATGYYERDDEVICKLCDVVMNKATIGFKGGCNPVPLAFTIDGGKMRVATADLDAEQRRFK
ncbi:MAG: Fe-S-containing protein [Clostridiales Family XIII bacterium]|nr:Fe-S-containing protein [Clostridiales Family XIII bacterium]